MYPACCRTWKAKPESGKTKIINPTQKIHKSHKQNKEPVIAVKEPENYFVSVENYVVVLWYWNPCMLKIVNNAHSTE